MARLRPCYCTGGCCRDLNADDAPERSGVNGLCVDCFEREEERAEEEKAKTQKKDERRT